MKESSKAYAVDGNSLTDRVEDGIEMRNFSQLGGTDADEHEMRMLGRIQQLNVSGSASSQVLSSASVPLTTIPPEKLPLHLDIGLRLHPHEHLGNCPHVRFFIIWRKRRRNYSIRAWFLI